MNLTVFQFIEDFDNTELFGQDYIDQLEEAVRDYNEQFNTDHDPAKTVMRYLKSKSLTIY